MTTKPTIRMFVPFILLLALCAALMALVLRELSLEANRLDFEHMRSSVSAAFEGEADQMRLLADDNGLWDDAAQAVYTSPGSPFLWSSWGAPTGESTNYSMVAVVDRAGRTLVAFEGGKAVRLDVAAEYGGAMRELLRQATATKIAKSGFVSDGKQPMIVGVREIMPISRSLEHLIPAEGPYRLVMARPLSAHGVSTIARQIGASDLHLIPATEAGSHWPAITDTLGNPIVGLRWTLSAPGARALDSNMPIILGATAIALLMAFFVMREWQKMVHRFHSEALTDSLSGLPNRRSLRFDLGERLSRGEPVALAMLDLDGFKAVNDRFGHMAGDRLINEVSGLLQSKVGPHGLVARLGGDEFAIMMTGSTAADAIEAICRDLLLRFVAPFRLEDRTAAVGVSIGLVASAPGVSASELMRQADVALYSAKRAGKMRYHWYQTGLDEAQARARSIESDLRTALEKDQFSLVYQPLFDHAGKRIRSAEALLRWSRPGKEKVEPGEFIPIAEYSGLIDKIGLWVIRRACIDGLAWAKINVSVNVSMAQLRNPEFPDLLAQVLEETGFPPMRLELEISERFLAADHVQARRMIEAIRALGVSVVLDEFGSGLTSLGFLRSFNFSKLKVDRSLTAEVAVSEATRNVVHSSVAVARALGMAVTIGGVENQEQADLMRIAGCDELQGWHLSGELASDEISSLLEKQAAPRRAQRRV